MIGIMNKRRKMGLICEGLNFKEQYLTSQEGDKGDEKYINCLLFAKWTH
jgi:hypothetical protein